MLAKEGQEWEDSQTCIHIQEADSHQDVGGYKSSRPTSNSLLSPVKLPPLNIVQPSPVYHQLGFTFKPLHGLYSFSLQTNQINSIQLMYTNQGCLQAGVGRLVKKSKTPNLSLQIYKQIQFIFKVCLGFIKIKIPYVLGVVLHDCNPNTQEIEAKRS